MTKIYEGDLFGSGLIFAIVVSRFNSFVTDGLLEGALDTLKRHGVNMDDVSYACVNFTKIDAIHCL